MSVLNDREKYCLTLLIAKGGQAHGDDIRDIILEHKESFNGLSEQYLRYQAVKRMLNNLVKKGYVTSTKDIFKINPIYEVGIIQQFPVIASKAMKNVISFRKNHVLEFNTSSVEGYLLTEDTMEEAPYGLIENLQDALKLYKIESYDSVLVKCGKCVEIMMDELNDQYELFDSDLRTGNMINQLRNEQIREKLNHEINKDYVRTFTDSVSLIYNFRNIMGAHSGFEWGQDQVATSCLILTFYLSDLYIWAIRRE